MCSLLAPLASQVSAHPSETLCDAVRRGDLAAVRICLERRDDVDCTCEDRTPLIVAVDAQRLDLVDALLVGGATVGLHASGSTALAHAVSTGSAPIVRRLVDAGARLDLDFDGPSEFHQAAGHGDPALIEALLPLVPTVDVTNERIEGRTALHFAAEHGSYEVARLLVQHGASRTARDAHGWTPLHLAAMADRVEVLPVLVDEEARSELDATDIFGDTPLHWAAALGNAASTEKLLVLAGHRHPIERARDRNGWSPLHCAVHSGSIACAKSLLAFFDAPVRETTKLGRTPLHLAARRRDESMQALLLAHDAPIDLRDVFGRTPFDLARGRASERIALQLAPRLIASPDGRPPTADAAATESLDRIVFSVQAQGLSSSARDPHREPGAGTRIVLLAAWSDGAVLFPLDDRRPRESLRVGRIEPTEFRAVAAELEEAHAFELPRWHSGVGVDAGSAELEVSKDGRRRSAEICEDSCSFDLRSASDRVVLRAWRMELEALEELAPLSSWPLADASIDGSFRGLR